MKFRRFPESLLASSLACLNYIPVRSSIYRATFSTADVEHFIYVKTDERTGVFTGASYGFRNPLGEPFSIDCMVKYRGALNERLRRNKQPHCLLNIEFHLLEPRDTFWADRIAESPHKAAVDLFIERVRESLLPMISHIIDLPSYLGFLLSDKPPVEWILTSPAIRFAHIASVARQMGLGKQEIEDLLAPHLHRLELEREIGERNEYLSNIIADWDARH